MPYVFRELEQQEWALSAMPKISWRRELVTHVDRAGVNRAGHTGRAGVKQPRK